MFTGNLKVRVRFNEFELFNNLVIYCDQMFLDLYSLLMTLLVVTHYKAKITLFIALNEILIYNVFLSYLTFYLFKQFKLRSHTVTLELNTVNNNHQ